MLTTNLTILVNRLDTAIEDRKKLVKDVRAFIQKKRVRFQSYIQNKDRNFWRKFDWYPEDLSLSRYLKILHLIAVKEWDLECGGTNAKLPK